MAYLTDTDRRCQRCGARASKALYNNVNACNGYFCTAHGKRALRELQELESRQGDATRDRSAR